MTAGRIARAPCAPLRPFIAAVWAVDETADDVPYETRYEHVLPTGQMHLVLRLRQDPLRIFPEPDDRAGALAGPAVIGGARDTFYRRGVSGPQCSVGAQLRPGGADALFGIPAAEFAHRHTELSDVWGLEGEWMIEQLADLPTVEARVDAFESMLLARVPRVRAMHPAVAQALSAFTVRADVGRVISATGYSHRTMIALFRRSVGLAPKQYVRVLRFRRALRQIRLGDSLAAVALDAGYSDQAHLSRDFKDFAGASPSDYRRVAPEAPHHLPVPVR